MLRSIIAATLSLCLVSSVSTAAVTPSKPSQLADLGTSYQTPCPQVFPDADVYPIDVINLPDGTTAPPSVAVRMSPSFGVQIPLELRRSLVGRELIEERDAPALRTVDDRLLVALERPCREIEPVEVESERFSWTWFHRGRSGRAP